MAKKGSARRVFQLAKELGVASKDVVEKCKSEDIPNITNHMSAVSVGLEVTIREWFSDSEGGVATAVETAAPVDIMKAQEQVRKKAARKKKASRKSSGIASDDAAPEVVVAAPGIEAPGRETSRLETPGLETSGLETSGPGNSVDSPRMPPVFDEPLVATEPSAPSTAPDQELAEVAAAGIAPGDQPVDQPTDQPGVGQAAEGKPDPTGDVPAGPVMNVPSRPEVIGPAGPKLQQPEKTKLTGPRVIRVESPETIPPPQARRSDRSEQYARGGGGRGAGFSSRPDEAPQGVPVRSGDGASRRNKRRSASAGRDGGRTARTTPGTGSARPFNWREQDLLERERRLNRSAGFLKAARRDNQKRSAGGVHRAMSAAQTGGSVKIEEPITVKALSAATGAKVNDIIRHLVQSGHIVMGTSAVVDTEKAREVMLQYDIDLEIVEQKTAEQQIVEEFKDREVVDEQPRPPVVTILGHVDHGKTTLLDRIRNANVAEGEAGGITQAVSAFQVPIKVGDVDRTITFFDTPGHEAFTEMRSRGARVTDIVVLVVAADDGVMPQTIESINHAKAADVPIVVALNKVDKPEATDANIQRILGQLAEHELNPTEWGGSTEVVRMSAVKGEGVDELLELLDYQAQLLDLKAGFGGPAAGTVIEAQLEEGRGPVARILVQHGKLKKGEYLAIGRAFGRVRDIIDDHGRRIEEAGPSMPVAVSGINQVPDAGDNFYVVKNLREAESASEERKLQERERDLAQEKVTLDNIFEKLAESGRKDLPLVVKADVQGSLETLRASLGKIGSEEVVVTIKHSAVGGVNESDVALAEASGAIIIAFNVTAAGAARRAAEARGVDVRYYDVIYDLTDDVKRAAEGLLEPELKLEILGHAEVKEVFKVSKVGMIAGCYVTDGNIERNAQIRVTRDGIVVEKDRRLEQLKRFKDDAKSVNAGQECGMRIDGYDDIKPGDVLECYKTLKVRRTLG